MAKINTSEGAMPLDFQMEAPYRPHGHVTEHARWSPYDFNGGTTLAVAGEDFVVVAADTRLSSGYRILSRNVSKIHKLTDKTVIASPGCFADVSQLWHMLNIRCQMYEHNHGHKPSTEALAQLLMTTLYYRRFFPYYALNLLVGLDKEGKGAIYSYDALGSHERVTSAAQGSGQKLMIPLLDNVIEYKNRLDKKRELTAPEVINLMKDSFLTAGERDIYTGDAVEIMLINKDGISTEFFKLKDD